MVKLPDDYPFPLHLSTAGDSKNRLRPLVKFQPVRLVNFRPASTERVYLHAYDSVGQARASILDYFEWYNHERPHSSLNRKTPHQAYNDWLPNLKLAA